MEIIQLIRANKFYFKLLKNIGGLTCCFVFWLFKLYWVFSESAANRLFSKRRMYRCVLGKSLTVTNRPAVNRILIAFGSSFSHSVGNAAYILALDLLYVFSQVSVLFVCCYKWFPISMHDRSKTLQRRRHCAARRNFTLIVSFLIPFSSYKFCL